MGFQDNLVKGKQNKPPRIVIYGNHGIGKSSLGLGFPAPIFIDTEGGLEALDAVSFPKVTSLDEVKQNLAKLIKEPHEFQTAVLDTVDWLVEPLISQVIDARYDAKEQAYGKGQMYIAEEFRTVLEGFNVLRERRSMNIVFIAHAYAQRYENPMTEPYDRFQPKLPKNCNALLQEWADVLAFASPQIIVKKTDAGFNRETRRGVATGDRQLHLVESAAYVAKCRYPGAPNEIPMNKDAKVTVKALAEYIPISGL